MKFFNCSECLTGIEDSHSSVISSPCYDPLLITKRPRVKPTNDKSHQNTSIPRECCNKGEGRIAQIPIILRAALTTTWRRKRRLEKHTRLKRRKNITDDLSTVNPTSIIKKKRVNFDVADSSYRSKTEIEEIEGRKDFDLEGEYYEHLEAFKLILDPPNSFANTEVVQNSSKHLNSLDFRQINTIAIPHESNWNFLNRNVHDGFRRNYIIDNVAKIDNAITNFFQYEPMMMKKIRKSCLNRENGVGKSSDFGRESKTVRFKVNENDLLGNKDNLIVPELNEILENNSSNKKDFDSKENYHKRLHDLLMISTKNYGDKLTSYIVESDNWNEDECMRMTNIKVNSSINKTRVTTCKVELQDDEAFYSEAISHKNRDIFLPHYANKEMNVTEMNLKQQFNFMKKYGMNFFLFSI